MWLSPLRVTSTIATMHVNMNLLYTTDISVTIRPQWHKMNNDGREFSGNYVCTSEKKSCRCP